MGHLKLIDQEPPNTTGCTIRPIYEQIQRHESLLSNKKNTKFCSRVSSECRNKRANFIKNGSTNLFKLEFEYHQNVGL